MEPLTSRALRSISYGVIAVGLAYVAGYMFTPLQNPIALVGVFVLVAAAGPSPGRLAEWVWLHPAVMPVVLVLVLAAVLFVVSPTYIARMGPW